MDRQKSSFPFDFFNSISRCHSHCRPHSMGQYLDKNDQHRIHADPDYLQFTCDSLFTSIRRKEEGGEEKEG